MAKHLTDRQRKRIVADYIECGSYNAVAKKHNVSFGAVKRAVLSDEETVKKIEQKKEKNTEDVLSYLDARKSKACEIIDTYLEALLRPEKLEKATVNQLSTALGTVIDKFTMTTRNNESNDTGVVILPIVSERNDE